MNQITFDSLHCFDNSAALRNGLIKLIEEHELFDLVSPEIFNLAYVQSFLFDKKYIFKKIILFNSL